MLGFEVKIWLIVLTTLCFLNIQQISAKLTDQQIALVAANEDEAHYQRAFKNILKPRVVGTASYQLVQNYIVQELKTIGFDVELDTFQDTAPHFGQLTFTNIIAKINPNAEKFLTLACHYDSKYFREHNFVGASDSAVPCTIMLNIGKQTVPIMKDLLTGRKLGLMMIFFDGEEAFREWSATDSLYGSRHLAKKWELQPYKNGREIDRINVMVLLDLIGASGMKFMCTFANTCPLSQRLTEIESFLKRGRMLTTDGKNNPMFARMFTRSGVDDDHRPFLERGVPILHLIPQTFPKNWHQPGDDENSLNPAAIKNFNTILRIFVIEYLTDCANLQGTKCSLQRF